VSKLEIYQDSGLKNELNNLVEYQCKDPKLSKISIELSKEPMKFREKYMLKRNLLYRKDNNKYPYWRVMLPSVLENRIFKYVHDTLGHPGTDKCISHLSQSFYIV
jgi:hypothetical protein